MKTRWSLIIVSIPTLLSSIYISFVNFEIISHPFDLPNDSPPLLFALPLLIIFPPLIASWSGVFWIFQSQNLAMGIGRAAMTFLLPPLWLAAFYFIFVFIYSSSG